MDNISLLHYFVIGLVGGFGAGIGWWAANAVLAALQRRSV